ncbi:hypothetical protein AB0D08_34650 [Kitasatospora sp. NPDC048540]|uniref:hypothetical protein n=1 Tax=Kitasatospora sp. NPDC048540 TaxID=3155634 RepID=UPI0033FEC1BB
MPPPSQPDPRGTVAEPEAGGDRPRRLDLSVAQVVASALAAVAGAVLASELGVYGTIIGAAVVSVGATVGSAVFQHLFRRTGEQLLSAVDRGPGPVVNGLRQVPAPDAEPVTAPSGEWSEPRLVRAKGRRGWRTYTTASALVFALAMVPILAVEVLAGRPVSSLTGGDSRTGTSLTPGRSEPPRKAPVAPSTGGSGPAAVLPSGPSPSGSPSGPSPSGSPDTTADPGSVGAPSGSPSTTTTPPAGPAVSPSGAPAPSPSATAAGKSSSPTTPAAPSASASAP